MIVELNHHQDLDAAHDRPKVFKVIFLLISGLRMKVEDLNPQRNRDPFNANHTYDKQLIRRAEALSEKCRPKGINERPESYWQSVQSPLVFLSVNNEDEEKTTSERLYHHWYKFRFL